jgi:hypothetical protein
MNSWTEASVESSLESSTVRFVDTNCFRLKTRALIVLDCSYGVVPANPTSRVYKSYELALNGLSTSCINRKPSSASYLIFRLEQLTEVMSSMTIDLTNSSILFRTSSAGFDLNYCIATMNALIR